MGKTTLPSAHTRAVSSGKLEGQPVLQGRAAGQQGIEAGMAGRYYEARMKAMEDSTAMSPRAMSEYPRGRSRDFGCPDVRSSSIEINTGRLSKRVIRVTSLHSNDRVPLYLGGDSARAASVVRDTFSPCPSTIGTRPQKLQGCLHSWKSVRGLLSLSVRKCLDSFNH